MSFDLNLIALIAGIVVACLTGVSVCISIFTRLKANGKKRKAERLAVDELKDKAEALEESEKVKMLDLGANDYITKPFGSEELLARVRTALRNSRYTSAEARLPGRKFTSDDLVIDYEARQVFIADHEIKLTQTEYNIVAFLSDHCGKMMTYASIIKAVWRESPDDASIKKLQVNMANIRKKFGAHPGEISYIVNELGIGYRMKG
jgi:two-component system KDP operon response regulator KdpE